MSPHLRPCPFCGSTELLDVYAGVQCETCGARGPYSLTAEQAERLWNRGDDPDFLVLIDRAIWSSLDETRRERLVYHERCHVVARENEYGVPTLDRAGRPRLALRPHDAEVFYAEILRYGAAVTDSEELAIAIAEGEARRRLRGLKLA